MRSLGNIHRHTVQCVLPINLFNEKIFVFIWFWLAFVALLNIFSWFEWFLRAVRYTAHTTYVSRQLKALDKVNRELECRVPRFVAEYLCQDGVFVTRLIAKNAGEIIAAEILGGLWDIYTHQHRLVTDRLNSPANVTPADPILA